MGRARALAGILALSSLLALPSALSPFPAASPFAALSPLAPSPAWADTQSDPAFARWVAELRREAVGGGIISAALFDEVFAELRPIARIIELDRRQPEFTLSFADYYLKRVDETRVERGRTLLAEHRDLLAQVEARYGVPQEILVAFWGLETAYGKHFGTYNTVAALATLAYDQRRARFFRRELLVALALLEEGAVEPEAYLGSWAGAFGHMQFMPSTYDAWAVDGDGDGKRNLYASLPDAFHSAGAFLKGVGWRAGEPWGEEVRLGEGFAGYSDVSVRTPPETKHPRRVWAGLGVARADGSPLPADDLPAALLLPAGAEGPAFLVYRNYERILNWNRSLFYALSVGSLADQVTGAPPLARPPPPEERVRISEIRALQEGLAKLGSLRAGD